MESVPQVITKPRRQVCQHGRDVVLGHQVILLSDREGILRLDKITKVVIYASLPKIHVQLTLRRHVSRETS